MAGCESSIEETPAPARTYTIKVSDDTGTRTTLGDNHRSVSWAAGDEICLVKVGDTQTTVFTYVSGQDAEDGCSLFETTGSLSGPGEYRAYYCCNRENAITCEADGVTLRFVGPKQNHDSFGDIACMYTPDPVTITFTADDQLITGRHFHFEHLLTYLDITATLTNSDAGSSGTVRSSQTLKRVILLVDSGDANTFQFATRVKIDNDGVLTYSGDADRVSLEFTNPYVYMAAGEQKIYTGVIGVKPHALGTAPTFKVYMMFCEDGNEEAGFYNVLWRTKNMPTSLKAGDITQMNLQSDYIVDAWEDMSDTMFDKYVPGDPGKSFSAEFFALFSFPAEPWL